MSHISSIILSSLILYSSYCQARRKTYDYDVSDRSDRRVQRTNWPRTRKGAADRRSGVVISERRNDRGEHRRMTPDNASIVFHYFQNLSSSQMALFNRLGGLYNDWNQRINLISRKDIENLYLHHVLHSLAISRVINFTSGSRILDFGTGGGFPGIPLAILFPEVSFHLVDSRIRKFEATEAIVSALELKNVVCSRARGEDIEEKYDFILGRAIVRLRSMYDYVKDKFAAEQNNIFPNGLLYLTGKSEDRGLPCTLQWYPLGDFFKESYFSEKYLVHAYPTDAVNHLTFRSTECSEKTRTNNSNHFSHRIDEANKTDAQVKPATGTTEIKPFEHDTSVNSTKISAAHGDRNETIISRYYNTSACTASNP